jgi:hypothetical protein
MNKNLIDLIQKANFSEAKNLLLQLQTTERDKLLTDISYEMESIAVYSFICYLINETSDSSLHELAVNILIHTLNYIEGAYSSALYHAKKLLELEPNSIGNKELILFFFDIPEKLISETYALKIAEEILEKCPDNVVALRVVSVIGGKK